MSTNKEEYSVDINVDAPIPEVTNFESLVHGDVFTIKGEHGSNVPVYMKTRVITDVDEYGRKSLLNAVGLLTGNLVQFKSESKVYKLKGEMNFEYE